MSLESPFDIMGFYHGADFATKSGRAASEELDHIFLYRRPILDYWCETAESLYHVMIHEIGHHLGLSDDDVAVIEVVA